MAILNFNAQTVPPQQAFEPIPADWYNVMIDESEIKPTNGNTGHYLELRLNVIDGPYANRKIFVRLNIDNPNQTAVEIAYQQLSAICHAVGVINCTDSNLLHGKPLQAKVSVRPPKGDYEASNDVKGFKAISGGAPAGGAQPTGQATPAWANKPAAQPEQQAQPQTAATPSWQQQAATQEAAPDTTVEKQEAAPQTSQVQEQQATGAENTAAAAKPPWVK